MFPLISMAPCTAPPAGAVVLWHFSTARGRHGFDFTPSADDVRLCLVQPMDELSQQRVAQLAGKPPASWRRIARGYTPAERWQVTFADGSTAFAKFGSTPLTAQWLRAEHAVYGKLSARFMPRLLGYAEHVERPLLLLEDLS